MPGGRTNGVKAAPPPRGRQQWDMQGATREPCAHWQDSALMHSHDARADFIVSVL